VRYKSVTPSLLDPPSASPCKYPHPPTLRTPRHDKWQQTKGVSKIELEIKIKIETSGGGATKANVDQDSVHEDCTKHCATLCISLVKGLFVPS
jgi:hypothetical protein